MRIILLQSKMTRSQEKGKILQVLSQNSNCRLKVQMCCGPNQPGAMSVWRFLVSLRPPLLSLYLSHIKHDTYLSEETSCGILFDKDIKGCKTFVSSKNYATVQLKWVFCAGPQRDIGATIFHHCSSSLSLFTPNSQCGQETKGASVRRVLDSQTDVWSLKRGLDDILTIPDLPR